MAEAVVGVKEWRSPYASSLPVYANAISAVDRVLRELEPQNVDVGEVVVTGERERACIVVIPHHQLGGISLLVWSDVQGIQLSWGHVTTLSRHDDVDLAVRVSRPIASGEIEGIDRALSAEMRRPIAVQFKSRKLGNSMVECSIDIDGQHSVIGRVRLGEGAKFEGPLTTTLADGALPFTVRVPLEELRRSA